MACRQYLPRRNLRGRVEGEEGHHRVAGVVVHADWLHDEFLVAIFFVAHVLEQNAQGLFGGRDTVRFGDREIEGLDVVDELVFLVELLHHVLVKLDGLEPSPGFLRLLLCEPNHLTILHSRDYR